MIGHGSLIWSIAGMGLSLALSPALPGVVNRTKAFFAGRKGQPLLQGYYDMFKLLRKGSVYSRTSTEVLRLAPLGSLAVLLCASALLPLGGQASPLSFEGDMILFIYLMGLARVLTAFGALDTGSSFEGMGVSRELQFAVLAELAFISGICCLAFMSRDISLSGILRGEGFGMWNSYGASVALVGATFLCVMLAECCRVPFDDPNTHLELTMIHEVMVLDYGGPDLALVNYAASLKMWLFGSILAMSLLPIGEMAPPAAMASWLCAMPLLGILVGTAESVMARFRLLKIPQMLVGAAALSLLALLLTAAR